MKKYKFLGILILLTLLAFVFYGCGRILLSPEGATPGYKIYTGTDPSGQKFSFEYPESWTAEEETLSEWNNGKWIMFLGPGDWETSIPILSLWIVPTGGTLTDKTSYNAAAYSDRNVATTEGTGPGLISEASTSETVASLTAEGWRIIYRTCLPLGRIYMDGDREIHDLMAGDPVNAENEWIVFQKGNCIYDLNFLAMGEKLNFRDSAYLHAKKTFKFE